MMLVPFDSSNAPCQPHIQQNHWTTQLVPKTSYHPKLAQLLHADFGVSKSLLEKNGVPGRFFLEALSQSDGIFVP